MWELINANRRRSMVLVFFMLVLLVTLGFLIGTATFGGLTVNEYPQGDGVADQFHFDPAGGILGIMVAVVIWMVQLLIAYFKGDAILMASSGARRIEKEDHPQLFNVVEEMCIASRLPKVPEVYIIDDDAMNAFAAGRKPETAKVAVTSGLLARLNRDQLQGVVAHEIAHIVHRDVLFMTLIGVMLGAIVLMSELFLRTMHFGGSRYAGGGRREGGGGAQLVMLVLAIVFALLAPLIAQLIYFAVSRRREYLADAGAAVYTRYPEGLASALEVLSGQHEHLQRVSKATAPMFIVNPLNTESRAAFGMFATHPPAADRIQVLRSLAGGVSYANYQNAWRQVDHGAWLPKSLAAEPALAIRAASPDSRRAAGPPELPQARQRARDAGDVLRKLNDFIFVPCACGMRIKLPPEWKEPQATCPRCGTVHQIPIAGLATAAAVLNRQGGDTTSTQVVDKPRGAWATVQCRCGARKSLSPSFSAPKTRCDQCGTEIAVRIV